MSAEIPAKDLRDKVATFKFRDDIATILKPGGVGVELGVAAGDFSSRILDRSALSFLYSVDRYTGESGHDINQYRKALKRLNRFRGRNSLLKMSFEEALPLFDDGYFDFIYIDGQAHTGQENGQTLRDWYPKLKSGGVFSGDDYDRKWPLTVKVVDEFMAKHGLELLVIDCHEETWPSQYPTWLAIKP